MRVRDFHFRQFVAVAARGVQSGDVDFFDFIKQIGGYCPGDALVDELIDLFEHQPSVGGWFGVSPETHSQYVAQIDRVIKKLEADAV